MQAPHQVIIEYLKDRLNIAIITGMRDTSVNIPIYDHNILVCDDFVFTTALPFKLANETKLSLETVGSIITNNITDPFGYFDSIVYKSGYLNFHVSHNTCYDLLNSLKSYLGKKANHLNELVIKYSLPSNESLGTKYRLLNFLAAKKNLLSSQGYSIKLVALKGVNYSSLEFCFNNKKYRFLVSPINDNMWNEATNSLSPFAINYYLLLSDINSNVLFNSPVFNINDPLYRLFYIYSNPDMNSVFFNKKSCLDNLLIRKLLLYPQKLEICNTNSNFKALFFYLNDLTRLTFDYDLWQNCTEKISIGYIAQLIIRHAVELFLISNELST